MEIFRSLGCLAEAPGPEIERLADVLDLGPVPAAERHTDLFLFQLYPLASVYLDNEGKIGGVARDRIAGFWRAIGLTPPPEPEHLTVLLSFYSQLRERHEAAEGLERERWEHTRKAFLWEHLLSWLPLYLDKVQDLDSGFYGRWARMLGEILAEDASATTSPRELPLHLREAAPMVDPRRHSGEAFLDSLTTPVRSGFILTRDDLVRAGHELELGVRRGERRYVLKALLGQDDSRTLVWLARAADRSARRHRDWQPWLGETATFWVNRATTSSRLLTELAADLGS